MNSVVQANRSTSAHGALAAPHARGFMLSRTSGSVGFTLIELLVVIAIIGILSSVVLASLGTARAKGRDARRISDIRHIQVALELWNSSNFGEYPDDIYAAAPSGLAPTYIPVVPTDPQGSNYHYANLGPGTSECSVASGACISYVLGADLEVTNPGEDVDGTVGEGTDVVNCADGSGSGTYCVRP